MELGYNTCLNLPVLTWRYRADDGNFSRDKEIQIWKMYSVDQKWLICSYWGSTWDSSWLIISRSVSTSPPLSCLTCAGAFGKCSEKQTDPVDKTEVEIHPRHRSDMITGSLEARDTVLRDEMAYTSRALRDKLTVIWIGKELKCRENKKNYVVNIKYCHRGRYKHFQGPDHYEPKA
jgi:hypothetical protein